MDAETQEQIEPFLKAVAQARQSLLMLDYDGTLAPFHKQRDQAFPYPGVMPLLEAIMRDTPTRVVIVSGRDSADVIPLLGLHPCPEMWGLHGLQRRKRDGTLIAPRLEGEILDALSDADRWLRYQQMQHLAEIKAGSIAVHWRGASEAAAEEIRGRALLGWKPIAARTGLELLDFDCGLEIRAPEADKGDAVRILLSEMPNVPAAYLGDDATDEHAFQAMRGRGLTILVRPRRRRTAAQVWLKPPEELLAFLTQWLETRRQSDTCGGESVAAGSP